MFSEYATTEQARQAALREQTERQCATGRHVLGCPHRVTRWYERAQTGTLPADAHGARAFVR